MFQGGPYLLSDCIVVSAGGLVYFEAKTHLFYISICGLQRGLCPLLFSEIYLAQLVFFKFFFQNIFQKNHEYLSNTVVVFGCQYYLMNKFQLIAPRNCAGTTLQSTILLELDMFQFLITSKQLHLQQKRHNSNTNQQIICSVSLVHPWSVLK